MPVFRLLRQQDALNSHAKAAAIKSKSKSGDGSEEYYGIMNDDDSIITDDGSGDDGSGEEDSESDEDNGDSTMTWDAYYNAEVVNLFSSSITTIIGLFSKMIIIIFFILLNFF